MSFGARLKEARKAKKLTQEEVALKLGIDDTTISKYENDRSEPDNKTLQELSTLYECSIDYLLGIENKNTNDKTKAEILVEEKSEQIIQEIVNRYGVDLTIPGNKEKLEKIIQIVADDFVKRNSQSEE